MRVPRPMQARRCTLLVTFGPFFAAAAAARKARSSLTGDILKTRVCLESRRWPNPTDSHSTHLSWHDVFTLSLGTSESAMFGSCCEEQEAQEAAVRSRIRAATLVSEKRLFGRSLAAARAQRFCKGVCCEPVECLGCGEDYASEEDETYDSPAESDPRMAHAVDEDEAELLQRLRATRLSQLHSAADKAAQPAVGYEYTEERTLLLLQDDAAAPPTVCLIGMQDDTELSSWLDDHLTVCLR